LLTMPPGWKAMLTILPANSPATVTPCTAVKVPTALRLESQVWDWAVVVVTVSAGMTNFLPPSIMALICRALMPASTATTRTRRMMAYMTRFFMCYGSE